MALVDERSGHTQVKHTSSGQAEMLLSEGSKLADRPILRKTQATAVTASSSSNNNNNSNSSSSSLAISSRDTVAHISPVIHQSMGSQVKELGATKLLSLDTHLKGRLLNRQVLLVLLKA